MRRKSSSIFTALVLHVSMDNNYPSNYLPAQDQQYPLNNYPPPRRNLCDSVALANPSAVRETSDAPYGVQSTSPCIGFNYCYGSSISMHSSTYGDSVSVNRNTPSAPPCPLYYGLPQETSHVQPNSSQGGASWSDHGYVYACEGAAKFAAHDSAQFDMDDYGKSQRFESNGNARNFRGYDVTAHDYHKICSNIESATYQSGPEGAYGAVATSNKTSGLMFDDYGRPITQNNILSSVEDVGAREITRAVPKIEDEDDLKCVRKFRVKLLQSDSIPIDVLLEIDLDGLRMLDPNTREILSVYRIQTITRWEVTEPSVYTFWARSPIDFGQRRISLKSNSYTTNIILDTVAAASIQVREMVSKETGGLKLSSNKPTKKNNPSGGWRAFGWRAAENVEREHWVPDEVVTKCHSCARDFGTFNRKHHCRNCGEIFCAKCSNGRISLTAEKDAQPVRVCDRCLAEVTQRLIDKEDQDTLKFLMKILPESSRARFEYGDIVSVGMSVDKILEGGEDGDKLCRERTNAHQSEGSVGDSQHLQSTWVSTDNQWEFPPMFISHRPR